MIVKVSEIPEEGLDVSYGFGPALFEEEEAVETGAEGRRKGKAPEAKAAERQVGKHAKRPHRHPVGETELSPAHQFGVTAYPGLRLLEEAHAAFHIEKKGSVILVDGEVDAVLGLECSRCTRKFDYPVNESFRVDLATPDSFGEEPELELHTGDLDVGLYDGEKIDLDAILREQLLLQLPIQPLCREDCKGLCQHCGKNLNKGECGCSEPTGHIGLSGLKELLDKMKEGEQEDGESDK